jgi:signal transduction histidine kinase/CheY-like chemotaxis protein
MKKTMRSWGVFVALALLGLAGNHLPIPLFFGIDFLVGNIFVFLALALLGTRAGLGVAMLAGLATLDIWGHTNSWMGLVVQTAVVGFLIWHKRPPGTPRNMPSRVAGYWVVLGIPLIAGLYRYNLGLEWAVALTVAFKQAVNDVFNALVAALLLAYLPVRRWCGYDAKEWTISLRGLQTNLLAVFAFFPPLVVMALLSQSEGGDVERVLQDRLVVRTNAMGADLQHWIKEHLGAAQALAQKAAQVGRGGEAELRSTMNFFAQASQSVAAVGLLDANGRVAWVAPASAGLGSNDFSDLRWFQRLVEERQPVLGWIPTGRLLHEPLVVVAAPVLYAGQDDFQGGVVLVYKSRDMKNIFSAEALEDGLRVTLLGRDGRVVFGSDPRFEPGQDFVQQRGGAVVQRLPGMYRWQPDGTKSKLQGWMSSYYMRQVALGEQGWSLVVGLPLQAYLTSLQSKLLSGLGAIFALVLLAFLVGSRMGRRIVRPLRELEQATTQLAQGVMCGESIRLRHHGFGEIDALVDNFHGMATQLQQSYDELVAAHEDLERRVAQRTADLSRQTEELAHSRDEAQRASRAKTEFLSSMSHEMRTPMNAILGFSQYLQAENLSEEHRMSVDEIYKAGLHLLTLIDDVLNLAKIEAGRMEMSLEPVELVPLVDECEVLVSGLAAKRGIALFHDDLAGVAVRADRVRLKQVLLNLMSNAIKYNRDGGRVRLSVQPAEGARLRIRVTDTGQGIAAERLGELFLPFNRLGAENSAIEGSGIGLTLTKRMVELMDGQVGVESQVGEGSTFWLELPQETVAAVADASAGHDGEGALSQENWDTVLYIEDNPINLKLVRHLLRLRKNTRMLSAHTPELGIELARSQQPDLILLDINLPGLDGYQVLRIFQDDEKLRHVPVVAITANALPTDIARGMAAGFADYLTKPLDIPHFNKVLETQLGVVPKATKPPPPVVPAAAPMAPTVAKAPTASSWETF